ncbi:ADP-ribosylation/Crystallin J1 [Desulfovibrio sp. X2]|uniref:ADP-ribosylglycohydrolase family protein n=1 Tax=Desulfovibrio sp. X2 TaxID=941449 RepID=UPI000358DC78|nr:ADP-ribosylglycohydrolase family protein [Desulfovibrio sp. X2]EPR37705.1 ADP-ribosylation/Crystallin J1 [Desulfovibrio sp. X2]
MTGIAREKGRRDRFLGALFGLAVGDAVGFPLKFMPYGTFLPVSDMVLWPAGSAESRWSDGTSMALCLAESLMITRAFSPSDQIGRYVRWLERGHMSSLGYAFDVDGAVRGALARHKRTCEPFSGADDERSATCSCLARLAPVPMFFGHDPRQAVEKSGESSRTTHQARCCVDACRYFGGLLWGALNGVPGETLLDGIYEPFPDAWREQPLCDEVREVAAGSFKRREPPPALDRGHVVGALEAALWAFHRSGSFRESVLEAASLGDEADSVAAVCGQLAGACHGFTEIPVEWSERIAMRQLIANLANALFVLSRESEATGAGRW